MQLPVRCMDCRDRNYVPFFQALILPRKRKRSGSEKSSRHPH